MSTKPEEPLWFRIAAALPADAEEPLIGALGDVAMRGLEVVDSGAAELDATLADLPDGWARVSLFSQSEEIEELSLALQEAIALLGRLELVPKGSYPVTVIPVEPGFRDRWKTWFKVTHVTPRIVIRPSWEPYVPKPGEHVLDLDPGTAFGTGGHATTRLCLMALDELIVPAARMRILDVGTGSGILAIAAVRLGAQVALAVDNDPEAVLVARENAAINGVDDLVRPSLTPVGDVPGTFDVVLANILAPTLIQLRDALVARVAPGGAIVLSGVLVDEGESVARAFTEAGLTVTGRRDESEWTAITLVRPLAPQP